VKSTRIQSTRSRVYTFNRLIESGMANKTDADSKPEHQHRYFRVVVTYIDGETSANRIFKDRAKAETFAARQEKSKVVKKTVIESFVRQQYAGPRVSKR
jgi:hypothetical protein